MSKVIILNGMARSGKDTFADYLSSHANDNGVEILKISTVDQIKKISRESFGVGSNKTDAERRLWSDLKDAWTRYNDGPFNSICEYMSARSAVDGFVIMCREPEEIAKFKDHFGEECITILMQMDDLPVPDNHADQNVANYEYMYVIENNGTLETLLGSAEFMFEEIFSEFD